MSEKLEMHGLLLLGVFHQSPAYSHTHTHIHMHHTHTHTHIHTHPHTLRSMEDTEKLRLKYLRSKRFYKEKVVPCSMSMSTNRRLCRPVYS